MTRTVWPTPDRSRLVDVGGLRVFVTDVGPECDLPLVLLHDVLTCGHAFAALLEGLPADRRYLVVDLPGCGESDRPDPAALDHHSIERLAEVVNLALASTGVARYEVLGQGFGALVAMAMASQTAAGGDAGERGVVRVIAVGVPRSGAHLPHEMRLAGLPAVGPLAFARAYRRVDLERTLARWHADPRTVERLAVDVYWDRLGRAGGMAAACDMLLQLERGPQIGERFSHSGVAALLVWGERDPIGAADRAAWAELLPNARTVTLEGCGHCVAQERPAALVDAVASGGPWAAQ